MSAMEKSLRRALEAGDSSDAAFRESIYSAAERALERMLAGKAIEPEEAHSQRVRLVETINRVEDEYFQPPAQTAADDERHDAWSEESEPLSPDPDDDGRAAADPSERAEDEAFFAAEGEQDPSAQAFEADFHGSSSRQAAQAASPDGADASWSPGVGRSAPKTSTAKARRIGPFAFGLVVIGIALVAGLVFFYMTVFAPMEDAASSAELEPAGDTVSAVIASAAGEAEWITLFDGAQLEMLATPNGGEVSSITGAGDRQAVRISASGDAGEIDVSIGPGVVNTIKGKKVRVEITVGSVDGTAREFSVRCLFGGDTVCGRQRFSTSQDSEAFVFDMVVPSDPAASGTIAIDPSFGAQSSTLDVYAVRLRPALDR